MLIGIFIQDFKIYRGINYIPITNTESFSALIGENGIGKSSIFEALDTLFNDSTWKINNNARSSSITALFAVDRKDIEAKNRSYENLRNKSKHLSYLELVDSIIRGCGIKDINTNQHIQDAVNKFLEHRDKIVGQFNSDTLFCLSGICSGSMIPDTKIGGNLTIKEVFNDKKTTSIIHSRVQA